MSKRAHVEVLTSTSWPVIAAPRTQLRRTIAVLAGRGLVYAVGHDTFDLSDEGRRYLRDEAAEIAARDSRGRDRGERAVVGRHCVSMLWTLSLADLQDLRDVLVAHLRERDGL
jgi:hypothetical protein